MSISPIGGRLRLAREARGLTQEELARRVNVTASTVSKWEQGARANPQSRAMVAVAALLGVSLDWLLLGKGRGPAAEVA